ncbi:MAG: carbohydrate-binding protein [Gammaproteobacteria bacterium]|nr:MAG: carbohydrate-binding protein [Gammaproteobacteria bacterium]
MFKKNEATRLGEVLLNKGLITSEQLSHAIKEQANRRKAVDRTDESALQATSIGEILIDLGYIDRLQLQRGLNWQLKLRKMTIAMALCAPFMSLSTGAAAAVAKTMSPTPITIEAENYTTMLGVSTETTTDTGGGLNVGWIDTSDWMSYTNTGVNLPTTGDYVITFRVASNVDGASFSFYNVGGSETKICTVNVPNTGGLQKWVTVEKTVTMKAGAHYFKIGAVTGGFNVNWFKVDAVKAASSPVPSSASSTPAAVTSSSKSSAAVSSTAVSSSKSSAAASSAPAAVSSAASSIPTTTSSSKSSAASSVASSTTSTVLSPVTIQAENYSAMGGVWNEPTSDTGGGQDTGNIDAGDWMAYANSNVIIPVTGNYKITYRVASLSAAGSFNLNELSTGEVLSTVAVPVTGGWQKWVDVTTTVRLTAGTHNFRILAVVGGFNVNWFRIEGTANSGTPSSTPTTTSSSSSSKPATTTSSSLSSSSKSSSSAASTSFGGGVVTAVAGPVGMSWTAPSGRLDGTVLDITEIGGYEIRYKLATDANYTHISINDAWTTQYNFAWLEGNYVFQVAAFDKNGVYSSFVDVQ